MECAQCHETVEKLSKSSTICSPCYAGFTARARVEQEHDYLRAWLSTRVRPSTALVASSLTQTAYDRRVIENRLQLALNLRLDWKTAPPPLAYSARVRRMLTRAGFSAAGGSGSGTAEEADGDESE